MLNGFTLSPLLAAVVLGAYALIIIYALIAPRRGPDPQRGVAVGCLLIVLAALLAVGALLAVAVRLKWGMAGSRDLRRLSLLDRDRYHRNYYQSLRQDQATSVNAVKMKHRIECLLPHYPFAAFGD
jgi:hypothetical protein